MGAHMEQSVFHSWPFQFKISRLLEELAAVKNKCKIWIDVFFFTQHHFRDQCFFCSLYEKSF